MPLENYRQCQQKGDNRKDREGTLGNVPGQRPSNENRQGQDYGVND